MTELLLGAHMSIAGGVSCALDRASSVGSNAVQVFTKNNRQWKGPAIDVEDVTRWEEEMPEQGIHAAVSHASYLINIASPKDDLWKKSMAAHRDELERAHAYGIPNVVLHPGAHTGSGPEAAIERIAEALNRIHSDTPECDDVITCLELMAGQGTVMGRNFSELRQIIELVDDKSRVGICADTCHAFAAGYDIASKDGYAETIQELEDELGLDALKVWHFNDSQSELGSHKDRHTHIGEGEIGKSAFSYILNDERWSGIPMLLETPKDEDLKDDVRNLATLVSLIEDEDRIPPGLRSES